jgi:hypothetical protein
MKNDDEDPPVWITVIKLVVIAVVIGGTGLALWYVDQAQSRDQPGLGTGSKDQGWGIVNDNPLQRNR